MGWATGYGEELSTGPVLPALVTHHRQRTIGRHTLIRLSYRHPRRGGWVTLAMCDCQRYAAEHWSVTGPKSSGGSALASWKRHHARGSGRAAA